EGRTRAIPGAGGVRAVWLGPGREDAGADQSRPPDRRGVQTTAIPPRCRRSAGGDPLGGPEWICGRRAGGTREGLSKQAAGFSDDSKARTARENCAGKGAERSAGRGPSGGGRRIQGHLEVNTRR